jgi:uncharacterized repeat protein (TIGR03837 family)
MGKGLSWDIFCTVVDNLGDAGVCWRLAADLGQRGESVRLFIDDARPLAWMAPAGQAGVQVLPWPTEAAAAVLEPHDVVIEAFGCNPPAAYVAAMAHQAKQSQPPVWINLEYLSAEPYVERSHGLPSPQANGLTKWFFFPGFTPRTGGLLRAPSLLQAQASFDRSAWLQAQGIGVRPGERVVSLFCYDNAYLPELFARLTSLSEQPTLLLLTPGHAQEQVKPMSDGAARLRTINLPWLSQTDYDHLLLSCDLNFVRGEDSLVRALWAGAPFVWQAYVQHDAAHHRKVQALLNQWQPPADVAALWQAWNGMGPAHHRAPLSGLPALAPWRSAVQTWRRRLVDQQPDLSTALCAFARSKRANWGTA